MSKRLDFLSMIEGLEEAAGFGRNGFDMRDIEYRVLGHVTKQAEPKNGTDKQGIEDTFHFSHKFKPEFSQKLRSLMVAGPTNPLFHVLMHSALLTKAAKKAEADLVTLLNESGEVARFLRKRKERQSKKSKSRGISKKSVK